jgi:hypothetical protein
MREKETLKNNDKIKKVFDCQDYDHEKIILLKKSFHDIVAALKNIYMERTDIWHLVL